MDFAATRLRQLFRKPAKTGSSDPPEPIGGEPDETVVEIEEPPTPPETTPRDLYYTSSDGLRLHVAEYGDPISPWLPVVCLPGLSRSARDFHQLGLHLSGDRDRPRRVLAFDLRGRGLSEWDRDVARYTPLVEMQDVLDGMAALGIDRATVVGTSRGGLIAMLMGVARPSALAGVVLNDIGPAIEPRGLARLKTYIGRMPAPDDWDDAARILRRLHGGQFTALDEEDWRTFARMTWRDEDGLPVSDYDPALARTFDGVEFDRPMPTLWREFAALGSVPVLVIRGENSDILSAETVARMQREHPRFEHAIVEGQGHPPLLTRMPILQRIAAFVLRCEGPALPAAAVVPRQATAFDLDSPARTNEPG